MGKTSKIKCKKCNDEPAYYELFDAEYCAKCNIWLIPKCSDSKCEFCAKRPTHPLYKDTNGTS